MRSLRILMVAPQPFFRPRGTPFSVLHRIRALQTLGHRVELVTYPFGSDPGLPGLTIHRSARPPFIRDVQIGPSFAKLALDAPLFAEVRRMVLAGGHDVLHTHEEAGFWGAWLHARHGIPHIYDMHSSLPQQFATFERFHWGPIVGAFERMERFAVNNSTGVITVYPDLQEVVRSADYRGPLVLLENTLDLPRIPPAQGALDALRIRLGLEGRGVVVYTGTLESYQGMEVLLEAGQLLKARLPSAKIISVGGTTEQVARLEGEAVRLGVARMFAFVPAVPPDEVALYHDVADALVTCRTRGTNTPLKLYQYMRSGRPIVATAIPSHTQVLDDETAELVPVSAEGVAGGIERVLRDPVRRAALADKALKRAEERYGEERHMRALEGFMEEVIRRLPGAGRASSGVERHPPGRDTGAA